MSAINGWTTPGFVDHHCHLLLEAGSKRVFIGENPRAQHLSAASRNASPADDAWGEPLEGESLRRSILVGLNNAARSGLVEITEPGLDSWSHFETALELRATASLPLRLNVLVRSGLAEETKPKGIVARRTNDAVIDVTGVKFYVDGWLGPQTCAVSEPFLNTDNRGLLFMDAHTLARRAAPFAEHELQIACHAIGDRAIETVLDAYEMIFDNPRDCAGAKPRLEHAQIMRQDLVDRIAEWGVTVCAQPSFGVSDYELVRDLLPTKFAELSYNWQYLIESNVNVVFGSDYHIAELSPMASLQQLVTGAQKSRKHVTHTLDLKTALVQMTNAAAGTTTLETNPFEVDPFELSQIGVLAAAPNL